MVIMSLTIIGAHSIESGKNNKFNKMLYIASTAHLITIRIAIIVDEPFKRLRSEMQSK